MIADRKLALRIQAEEDQVYYEERHLLQHGWKKLDDGNFEKTEPTDYVAMLTAGMGSMSVPPTMPGEATTPIEPGDTPETLAARHAANVDASLNGTGTAATDESIPDDDTTDTDTHKTKSKK